MLSTRAQFHQLQSEQEAASFRQGYYPVLPGSPFILLLRVLLDFLLSMQSGPQICIPEAHTGQGVTRAPDFEYD